MADHNERERVHDCTIVARSDAGWTAGDTTEEWMAHRVVHGLGHVRAHEPDVNDAGYDICHCLSLISSENDHA